SQDQLESLFQVDKTKTSRGTAGETGTGLGLIICKDFVHRNSGDMRIQSELGKGTTIYITFPRSFREVPAISKSDKKIKETKDHGFSLNFWEEFPVEKVLKLKGKKVLIVDDSLEQRMFLRTLLYETFEIYEAGDGKEGMKLAMEK